MVRTLPHPSALRCHSLAGTGDLYVQLPSIKRLIINFSRPSREVIFLYCVWQQPLSSSLSQVASSLVRLYSDVLTSFQENKSPCELFSDFTCSVSSVQSIDCPSAKRGQGAWALPNWHCLQKGTSHLSGVWIKLLQKKSYSTETGSVWGGFLPARWNVTQ